mgnify:CR=1 FL=1
MILAEKLIKLRKQNGWSQEDLAMKLNVSRQSVSKWESMASIPDLDKIVKLSQIFGVSTDYLLRDDIEEEVVPVTSSVDYDQEDTAVRVSMEEASRFLQYNEKAASPISSYLFAKSSKSSVTFSSCIPSAIP